MWCKSSQASTQRRILGALRKTPLFFEFSLCLSRACLGKMMHFIYKWRKKWCFFAPLRWLLREGEELTPDKRGHHRQNLTCGTERHKAGSCQFSVSLFVPSLSWQTIAFDSSKRKHRNTKGVSFLMDGARESLTEPAVGSIELAAPHLFVHADALLYHHCPPLVHAHTRTRSKRQRQRQRQRRKGRRGLAPRSSARQEPSAVGTPPRNRSPTSTAAPAPRLKGSV